MDRNNKMKAIIVKWALLLPVILASITVNAQPLMVEFVLSGTASSETIANMEKNANVVFTEINNAAIANRKPNLSKNNATDEAIKNIDDMWTTSHFCCTQPIYYQTINAFKLGGKEGYSVRNISIFFLADKTLDDKEQDIAIIFDENGKVSDISIEMKLHHTDKILDMSSANMETRHRLMLREFLEQFRTAYCRKDINYIEQVFSEYALIITGYKVTTQDKETGRTKTFVKYKEKDKTQYIADLKKVFANNKSLDIKFPEDKISIMQHEMNKNVYAIRCMQDWSSIRLDGLKGYSDSGWLTLIIDFTNVEKPEIWVRAWQDPSFTQDELVKVNDWEF